MARKIDNSWINFRGVDILWYMALPILDVNEGGQTEYYDTGSGTNDEPYNRSRKYKYMGKFKAQATSDKKNPNYKKEGEVQEGDALLTFSHDMNIGEEDRVVVKSWESREEETFICDGQVTQELGYRFMSKALYVYDKDGNEYTPTVDFSISTDFHGITTLNWITSPPASGTRLGFIYNSYPIYIMDKPGMNRSFGGSNDNQLLRRATMFLYDPRTSRS